MRTPFHDTMRPWAVGRMLLLILLGFLAGSQAVATAEETGFDRGNYLYASGKFAEATAAYETQVRQGNYSANLFYNLGNAYYRLGSRGRAVLNYRRALLLEPAHPEAAANLSYVSGAPRMAAWGVGAELTYWLTAGAIWLIVAGLTACGFSRRWRTAGVLIALTGIIGGAAGIFSLWQTGDLTGHGVRAVIVAADVPAHYEPADNSKVITKLPEGGEVRVLSAQGAWIYALLDDGTRAWVSSDKTEPLIPSR